MLAPQTISEKMRMKVMEVSTSDCVPEPVSPKVWEMIMAMRRLSAAARIFVPKVFRIFLNTMLRIGIAKIANILIRRLSHNHLPQIPIVPHDVVRH